MNAAKCSNLEKVSQDIVRFTWVRRVPRLSSGLNLIEDVGPYHWVPNSLKQWDLSLSVPRLRSSHPVKDFLNRWSGKARVWGVKSAPFTIKEEPGIMERLLDETLRVPFTLRSTPMLKLDEISEVFPLMTKDCVKFKSSSRIRRNKLWRRSILWEMRTSLPMSVQIPLKQTAVGTGSGSGQLKVPGVGEGITV